MAGPRFGMIGFAPPPALCCPTPTAPPVCFSPLLCCRAWTSLCSTTMQPRSRRCRVSSYAAAEAATCVEQDCLQRGGLADHASCDVLHEHASIGRRALLCSTSLVKLIRLPILLLAPTSTPPCSVPLLLAGRSGPRRAEEAGRGSRTHRGAAGGAAQPDAMSAARCACPSAGRPPRGRAQQQRLCCRSGSRCGHAVAMRGELAISNWQFKPLTC